MFAVSKPKPKRSEASLCFEFCYKLRAIKVSLQIVSNSLLSFWTLKLGSKKRSYYKSQKFDSTADGVIHNA